MIPRRLRLLLALLLGPGLACTNGTSLLLEVDPSAVPVEQVQLHGTVDGELAFGPAVRPEQREGMLSGTQTLRVRLPQERAGQTMRVRVSGLLEARVVAMGEAIVIPELNRELRVPLALGPASEVCANCTGCCDGNNRCLDRSVAACGAGGVACFACDPVLSDRCDKNGRCTCADAPACAPEAGADRCVDGACRCGAGAACPSGTECANGVCRCTAASCAGCCRDNLCYPGTTGSDCGAGGAACVVCPPQQVCEASACVARGS